MTINRRLILAFFALIFIAVAGTLIPTLWLTEQLIDRAAERELEAHYRQFMGELDRWSREAASRAALVASIPAVQEAMAAGDRGTLETLFVPGFRGQKKEHAVEQLQFHLPPATSFFRVHQPDKFGDDLSGFRQTVVTANRDRRIVAGVETGRGGLGVRGVAPVAQGTRHLGTVEFGLAFDSSFLSSFRDRTGAELEFYLLPQTGVESFAVSSEETVLFGTTLRKEPLLTAEVVRTLVKDVRFLDEVRIDGDTYAALGGPVQDFSGRPIGVLHMALPATHLEKTRRHLWWMAATVLAGTLLLGFLVAFVQARALAKPIGAITEAMKALAAGRVDIAVPGTGRGDEIGEIAKAVQVFKENAIHKMGMDDAEHRRLEAERLMEEEKRGREDAIGREIALLIDRVSKGDLEQRVDLTDKDGFYRTMSEAINRLTDTVAAVIADLSEVLGALAAGDLKRRVDQDFEGAFNTLKSNVNRTAETLAEVVGQIGAATEAIASAAAEVASGSTDLSARTEQQASSLEQTAASMEQLRATVRTSADNAERANAMSDVTRRAAEDGGKVADAAVCSMKEITESSNKIRDIIGVIDEIAFQTNLLALNAAVEAARAGNAGRGFAVVAQEVRNLAQHAAQASKEIRALINNSGAQVQAGADMVTRAGDALSGIVGNVQQVANLIGEMASASRKQAAALDEINDAVAHMDQMTQMNAALVEETTAASRTMADQADRMRRLMSFFKLDQSLHPPLRSLAAQDGPRRSGPPEPRGRSSGNSCPRHPVGRQERPCR